MMRVAAFKEMQPPQQSNRGIFHNLEKVDLTIVNFKGICRRYFDDLRTTQRQASKQVSPD